MEAQIDNFIDNLKLNPDLAKHYESVMKESATKIKKQFQNQLEQIDKQIENLEAELTNTVAKLKAVSSPIAVKYLEEELIRLEKELIKANACKQELSQKEPRDIKSFTAKFKHILEHFDEAIKNQLDPIKKARLFGLLFDRLPTYNDLATASTAGVNPLFIRKGVYKRKPGTPRATDLEPPESVSKFMELISCDHHFRIRADGRIICFICEEDDDD